MRIAIASQGPTLDSEVGQVFGRCPYLLFVDTSTGEVESHANPAMDASGGAGVQAARFVLDGAVDALIAPKLGPKAAEVLEGAGLRIELRHEGKVRQVVEDLFGALPS